MFELPLHFANFPPFDYLEIKLKFSNSRMQI
jgi:hypothetical protein